MRPKSLCTNSFTYAPAEVTRRSRKKCGDRAAASSEYTNFRRSISERRCITRSGVFWDS